MGEGKHWVLIETGGNQNYIFGSNRLRHVVGASQLVLEAGTKWVCEAVRGVGLPEDCVVMTASGKAMLLVDSKEAGQAVIRAVNQRALAKAPDLQVTGVVGDPFDPDQHDRARACTADLHARVRAARPDGLVRDRLFPWHRLGRDSGRPAEGREQYGDEDPVPASAGILARSAARDRGLERLKKKLGFELEHILPKHLDKLGHESWTAVVHADGNGVGGLFREFGDHVAEAEGAKQVSLETYVRYQRDVARELDDATWEAVRAAIRELKHDASVDVTGRLLPIVVGGDDVTLACDAALAVDFVKAFAVAYARCTAEKPTLKKMCLAATGYPGLTASAGIAVVKSHHPFATAYRLAEELTVSAKGLTHEGRALAAFDFHVAHVSTLRRLDKMREYVGEVARYAGPYLVDEQGDQHRSACLLDEITNWLKPGGWLSATQAHALREAADRGLAEYLQQLGLLLANTRASERAAELLAVQPTPERAGSPGGFLRLFDALHLRGLRAGAETSTVDSELTAVGGAR